MLIATSCCGEAGQRFDLIDDQDLYVLLRRNIEDLKLQYYVKAATPGQFLEGLGNFFKRCHDELRTPEDYDDYVAKLESKQIPLPRVGAQQGAAAMPEDEVLGRCREIARVFRSRGGHAGGGESGHLQPRDHARDWLTARPEEYSASGTRRAKGARFVLIDEFQDSNVAQIELTRLLAGEVQRLCGGRSGPGDLSISRRNRGHV